MILTRRIQVKCRVGMDESGTLPRRPGAPASGEALKRIGIFIVAYNAASTLRRVLDRIPAEIWDRVEEVFVFDDSSQDETELVGLGYKAQHQLSKLRIFRNEKNLGYGGNQIRGYKYAIERGFDIVALLHGDGQYAPECLPELLAPLERGEAHAVFGSRMLTQGGARAGGMPLYKYVGNKVLTAFENASLGTALSEFHSGYRLYSVAALKQIPFHKNTNEFHFDTQIIIQFHAAGLRIVEKAIPTFYGDEVCYVNGMKYAKDVVRSVRDFHMHNMGLKMSPEYEVSPRTVRKTSPLSSHGQLYTMATAGGRLRILDLGEHERGEGLTHELRAFGHFVVSPGRPSAQSPSSFGDYIRASLQSDVPGDPTHSFDLVLMTDLLEHRFDPKETLEQVVPFLAPKGRILLSLANAVHWSIRANVLGGRFEYTNRGILDRAHLRFFTKQSAERMFRDLGLEVLEWRTTPIPWEHVIPGSGSSLRTAIERADHFAARLAPQLFAYQHLFELGRVGAIQPGNRP